MKILRRTQSTFVWLGTTLRGTWRVIKYLNWRLAEFGFGIFLVFFIPFAIGNFVISTPRVQAYRNLHPRLPLCSEGFQTGWPDIARVGIKKLEKFKASAIDADDITNDEDALIDEDSRWADRLRCALQHHVVESTNNSNKPIDYYLSFLEFRETGEPYALSWLGRSGDENMSGETLRGLLPPNYLDLNNEQKIDSLELSQLDVLKHHLAQFESNYVIVFAHGWRHDASVGDRNVADLRLYAAHAVKFLQERCETEGLYCNTKVSAVYIGWRGARVNESGLKRAFGQTLGGFLGDFAAGATLFDRKPVSEQVAPGAISALRAIEKVLSEKTKSENKMIVFGHSLGGNLFATGLQDDLVKSVRLHRAGDQMPPVLGNLVVLINPAAEATKWTAIQREVWTRIAYREDSVTDINDIISSHKFFPPTQPPVILSATAALTFPAGGLRESDCTWMNMDVNDNSAQSRRRIRESVERRKGMFRDKIQYDWATHDLFPAFKFDFKPVASSLDRWVAHMEKEKSCEKNQPSLLMRLASKPISFLSKIAREFPFQNSNPELSHTIGNLDPLRPADKLLVNKVDVSSAPFGTTHELYGTAARPQSYADLGNVKIDCPPANYWLSRARQMQPPHGTSWDTVRLSPPLTGVTDRLKQNGPALQFLHGFNLAGQEPITRANDPFWNMRALDALSRHDGYRLSPFICAMNQLVMDKITMDERSGPKVN